MAKRQVEMRAGCVAALVLASLTTLCACSRLHRVVTAIDSTLFPPFLASPKQMPPACDPLPGFVLDGVFTPERLVVFQDCAIVTGTIAYITHMSDGDYHVGLKPDNPNWLNFHDPPGILVNEIVPKYPFPQLKVGQHVQLEGPYVNDLSSNWMEIHSIRRAAVLP